MSFLAPGAFAGLLLLSIPILVHLFKPRHVRQTPFSSLRWLHLTQQRMARCIQWHQVLLFLLRASFLSLLVFALARPLWTVQGAVGGVDRIVVLDVSRSMGRKLEGRPRPFDTARELAVGTLNRLQAGDRTAVLLTGTDTTVLAPWTSDPTAYLPALESLEPGLTGTNLDSSLEMIRTLLNQRRPDVRVEVLLLTDNTSGSWTSGAISSFVGDLSEQDQKGIEFQLVDVALPAPRNAWLAKAQVRETDAGSILHVEASCTGEGPPTRTLHVSGLTGVQDFSKSLTLEAGRKTSIDLPLPKTFDAATSKGHLRLEPPDEMPDDDELFVNLDASGPRLLLIEPETPAEDSLRPGFPLRMALKALKDAGTADFRLQVRAPAVVTTQEIAAAEVVILTDVPGLTTAQADAISQRVRGGAGAVMILGPHVEADVYNQRFVSPLEPTEGLLSSPLGTVVQAPVTAGGLQTWGRWNERHPLVAGLLDPLLGDLGQVRSNSYLKFRDPPAATDEVVAAFDDGTPALLVRKVGAGRVVLLNASGDDRWCDLPRRKSFVPLVDRIVNDLASAGGKRSFNTGEAVTVSLPAGGAGAGGQFSVKTPSGKSIKPRVESSTAGSILKLDGLSEPGFYSVVPASLDAQSASGTGTEGTVTFVVQPSRDESSLQPINEDLLASWWKPAKLEIMKPAAMSSALSAGAGRINLEPWLIMLAGLVLLAEMFLVHWLCPRVNPALAASRTHRRGFVPPLKSREGVPS